MQNIQIVYQQLLHFMGNCWWASAALCDMWVHVKIWMMTLDHVLQCRKQWMGTSHWWPFWGL